MGDAVGVDMRNVVAELKTCSKKYASSVRKQIRAAVTEAGAEIVGKVKASASSQGLHRAAAATTIRPNFSARSAGIRIVTSRTKAPYARAYEFGNYGVGGDTFKNGTGGVVHTRPYFFPSVEKMDKATQQKFLNAIDKACREAGFR